MTASPTFTEEPYLAYYVTCALPFVNARNFPSFDGQFIRSFPAGTILRSYEVRPDSEGINWHRVSRYEEFDDNSLWIRETDGVNTLLLAGFPSGCVEVTPIPYTSITPAPTATSAIPTAVPGCGTGNDCPHISTTISDVDLVAFILACEAGNSLTAQERADALGIAYVIRNRMRSGLYRGSAVDVISQSGQWQCYSEGARPGNNLATPATIDAVIRGYAEALVNGTPLPEPSEAGVRWYGLYTFGLFSNDSGRDSFSDERIIDELSLYCTLPVDNLAGIFIALAEFGPARFYATAFFSDEHQCSV
jgi:hypothetical protein